MKKFLLALLAITSFTITSCSNNDDTPNDTYSGNFRDGLFVLNEGNMGTSNSSITFLNFKNNVVSQNIFKTVNPSKTLGNTAQAIVFKDNKAFIVVNGSNKIEIVNAGTFISESTITTSLENPRYIAFDAEYFYVSNWGDPSNPNDDFISVFNKNNFSFVKKIDVVEGPEQLLVENNKLVVAHKGGWSNGNSVTIINLRNNTKENIIVGDVPSALVEENGHVYVLCTGISWGDNTTAGKLVKLDLNTNQISQTLAFQTGENPEFLVEENDQLYYTLNRKVYKTGLNSTSLPSQALFTFNATYPYGFSIKNNTIYIADAKDSKSNGEVKYYNQSGSLLGQFETGVNPNSISFN